MHAIAVDGPHDHEMFRLLMVIADHADASGANAHVDRRTIEERVKVGNRHAVTLVNRAIKDGWLVITRPGDRRRATVYALGVMAALRATVVSDDAHTAPRYGVGGRSDRARTLRRLNGSASAPTPNGSGARSGTKPRVPPNDHRTILKALSDNLHLSGTGDLPNWTAERHNRERDDP